MYVLKLGIKRDPVKRWALPDRVFFAHGVCHILGGVYLEQPPLPGFYAERISPYEGLPGGHIYVTDGHVAFDYQGYSQRKNLLDHHKRGWARRYRGWGCTVMEVDFPLLSTPELNSRKMLGPGQYLCDPMPRARRFIGRIDHSRAAAKASKFHP